MMVVTQPEYQATELVFLQTLNFAFSLGGLKNMPHSQNTRRASTLSLSLNFSFYLGGWKKICDVRHLPMLHDVSFMVFVEPM